MAGDSLMRDFFLAAVCLQSPHAGSFPKLEGMHFGTDGVLTLTTYFDTSTSFLWLDPPKWRTAEWAAVNGAALVLISGGSHAESLGELRGYLEQVSPPPLTSA